MMANWVMAAVHSRWAFFQSLLTRRKTKYSSLIAASSVGKCPRLRTAVRAGDNGRDASLSPACRSAPTRFHRDQRDHAVAQDWGPSDGRLHRRGSGARAPAGAEAVSQPGPASVWWAAPATASNRLPATPRSISDPQYVSAASAMSRARSPGSARSKRNVAQRRMMSCRTPPGRLTTSGV
jgi:hypothetical protein